MASQTTDEQRQKLVEQFIDAFDKSQDAYDLSIRTLASAAVAVTVSLAGWWGHGVGDGWQFAMLLFVGVGVLAAALGVWARGALVARTSARP